jgi:hypothetical protein
MRVDDRNLNGAAGLQPGRTSETDRSGSASGAQISQTPGGDRAEISSLAGTVSDAMATHSAGRSRRVAALAQQYRAGQYTVGARPASQALVHDALERKDAAQ